MGGKWPIFLVLVCAGWSAGLHAQLPFYTDDSEVTEPGTLHFEFFNEYDGLQSSEYPDLRQNTSNFKLNYGLPHGLELDLDAPYLAIYRAAGTDGSAGVGDADMGIKWKFRKAAPDSHLPALAATLYTEFPTGNVREQLGSGLSDYWLNFIAQEPFSDKTRVNANLGFLFAGNTSTGVVGVSTKRGHVFTGGLSVLHDFTPRLTLGGEVYGGVADTSGLGRDQLQGLVGGQYAIRETFSVTFGLLGGRYEASPRIGGQVGFAVDFPHFFRRASRRHTASGIAALRLPAFGRESY
jgi:Putative MetA-pathway of phenol degradation